MSGIVEKIIMLAINVEKLSKVYRKSSKLRINALDDFSLKVNKGEIFGFIGPNGAGKTTTIKILTGLLFQDCGKAYIFDEPAGTINAKSKLGFLPEISNYYNFLEADKLLSFYGSLYNLKGSDLKFRVSEVLSLVNLEKDRSKKLKEFSKGMMQRFGIAQAIIAEPELLIFDELTSGLDPIGQHEVMKIILMLKEKGKTIFFSSHRLTEVDRICDTVGIISKGKLLRYGKISEVFSGAKPLEDQFYEMIKNEY